MMHLFNYLSWQSYVIGWGIGFNYTSWKRQDSIAIYFIRLKFQLRANLWILTIGEIIIRLAENYYK